jgi:hypothetical protein
MDRGCVDQPAQLDVQTKVAMDISFQLWFLKPRFLGSIEEAVEADKTSNMLM